jgi:hypothetical protein
MAEDKGNVVLAAEVSQPVPAKDTFYTDDNVIGVGKDQFEKRFRIGFDILMNFNFAPLTDYTDVHF